MNSDSDDDASVSSATRTAKGAGGVVEARYNLERSAIDRRDKTMVLKRVRKLKKRVDLRRRCPPVYDQGHLGSCTANAIAAAYEMDEQQPTMTPSRLFIYYNERRIERTVQIDTGSSLRDGMKSLRKFGACPEAMWGYDIGKFDVKPSKSCYAAADGYKGVEYKAVKHDLRHIKACLMKGYPVVFGFLVFESFEHASETGVAVMPKLCEGVTKGSDLTHYDEQCIGGHAVLLVGYDDKKRTFIVRNSYGADWGDKGYFTMPYHYVANRFLCHDFWVLTKVVDWDLISNVSENGNSRDSRLQVRSLLSSSSVLKGSKAAAGSKKLRRVVKGGGASKRDGTTSPRRGASAYVLKCRLDAVALERVRETFGSQYVNGEGPLMYSAEWDEIVRLAQRHFGVGRWLPKLHLGSGSCMNVSWKLRTVLTPGSAVFGEAELKKAYYVLKYPNGKTANVSLRSILSSSKLAQHGDFCYYGSIDSSTETVAVCATAASSVKQFAAGLGTDLSYMLTGKFVYTIDRSRDLVGGAPDKLAGVVPVPRDLVDKLSARATGRKRDAALLRDLVRHANILVGEHPLVPDRLAGITASKLAFLALTHSKDLESLMYRQLIPGALSLNEEAAMAWSGKYTFSSWCNWLLGKFMLCNLLCHTAVMLDRANRRGAGKRPGNLGTLLEAYGVYELLVQRVLTSVIRLAVRPAFAAIRQLLGAKLMRTWLAVRARRALLRAELYLISHDGGMIGLVKFMFGLLITRGWVKGMIKLSSTSFITGRLGSDQPIIPSGLLDQPANILSVVSEELLKRAHYTAPYGVVLAEAVRCKFDKRYWLTAAMHAVTTKMPMGAAIAFHYAYNCVARYSGRLGKRVDCRGECDEVSRVNQCVDMYGLRDNESVVKRCKLVMPKGILKGPRCACVEPKPSIQFSALRVESVGVRAHRLCLCNERAAICSRVTSRHTPENPNWARMWSNSRSMPKVSCPDFEKWLSHLPSRARGLIKNSRSIGNSSGRELIIKAFVKREKHVEVVDGITTKTDRVPRLIQGRSVAVKIDTGPFTWKYGQVLKGVYGPESDFVYTGGLSSEQIGDCFEMIPIRTGATGACWHAIDCKRFDRSIGPSPLKCLYLEYKSIGAPAETLQAFKYRHSIQKGCTQHGIRYQRIAQVNSGDGDTSAGNSRIHLILLESCPHVYGALVHGDDSVVYTDDIDAVLRWYKAGDLDPVLAPDIDFCSGLFYPTNDGIVLGPKVGRVLAKTFQSLNKFDNYDPWLRGTLLSIRASCSFVPILRVIVDTLLDKVGHGKVFRSRSHEYKSMANRCHECTEDTFAFFEERYGLSESDCLFYEDMLRNTVEIGVVLHDQVFIDLVRRDML